MGDGCYGLKSVRIFFGLLGLGPKDLKPKGPLAVSKLDHTVTRPFPVDMPMFDSGLRHPSQVERNFNGYTFVQQTHPKKN